MARAMRGPTNDEITLILRIGADTTLLSRLLNKRIASLSRKLRGVSPRRARSGFYKFYRLEWLELQTLRRMRDGIREVIPSPSFDPLRAVRRVSLLRESGDDQWAEDNRRFCNFIHRRDSHEGRDVAWWTM